MDSKSDGAKPLHPGIYGCIGCGVVLVVLVGLSAYAVTAALREAYAEDTGGMPGRARLFMQRLPGGVIRGELVPSDTAVIRGLAWRDAHRVSFIREKIPNVGELMQVGGSGGIVPFWNEEAMRNQQVEMISRFEARHITQYDVTNGELVELAELPENMFFGGGRLVWDGDGRRVLMWLKPLDMLAQDRVRTTAALYLFDPAGPAEWTLLVERQTASWELDSVQWTPDGSEVLYRGGGDNVDDPVKWHAINVSTHQERVLPGRAFDADLWLVHKGEQVFATGYLVAVNSEWRGGITQAALGSGDVTHLRFSSMRSGLGRLDADEMLVADWLIGDDGTPRTGIGALNLRTGALRWIREDLLGAWQIEAPLLGGRAVLLKPDYWMIRGRQGTSSAVQPVDVDVGDGTAQADAAAEAATGEQVSKYDVEFDAPEQCLVPCVISLIDGGFTSLAGLEHDLTASADGSRAALRMERTVQVMGFVPAPADGLGILEFIYADELLSGGARQPAEGDE